MIIHRQCSHSPDNTQRKHIKHMINIQKRKFELEHAQQRKNFALLFKMLV